MLRKGFFSVFFYRNKQIFSNRFWNEKHLQPTYQNYWFVISNVSLQFVTADHLNFYNGSLLLLKWHIRLLFLLKMLPGILLILTLTPWCNGYNYCTNSFSKASYQVLRRLQSCSRHVRDLHWQESLTVAPVRNKA